MKFGREQIRRQIISLLQEQGADQQSLLDATMTLETLGFDSLDLAEIMVRVEELYEIRLDREDMPIEPSATIDDVIEAVVSTLSDVGVQ